MDFLAEPEMLGVVSRWAAWMVAMSWQVAVLALVVWVATRLMRRTSAALRYGLWLLVLIKLVLPPTFTAPWSLGNLTHVAPKLTISFDAPTQEIPQSSTAAPHAVAPGVAPPALAEDRGLDLAPPPIPRADTAFAHLEGPSMLLEASAVTPPPASPRVSWAVVLLLLWAVVAMAMATSLLVQAVIHYRRVAHDLRPIDPSLDAVVAELASRMRIRQRFEVRMSPHLKVPAVCYLRRPTILLPKHLVETLSPEQFRNLIGHELAHIKRYDLEMGWLVALLLCLYWFHPAVWVANLNLRREREMACDDEVLHGMKPESKEYAATMLKVAESYDGTQPAGSGFLGLFEAGEHLLQRIRSISDATRPRRMGLKSAMTVIAAAVLLVPMGIWTPATSAGESAIEQEIVEHYAKADPEVVEFIRLTADHFGPQGLWLDAGALDSLSPEERAAKVEQVKAALEGPNALQEYTAIAEAGALADPSFIPGLTKIAWYMKDGGQDNRSKWMAVAALGRIGDRKAVPALIPLVDHYNKNVRMWARASLVRLTGENFGADKQAWANWANAAGPETAIAPATLEWASRQSEDKMAAQRAEAAQAPSASSAELPKLGDVPRSADDVPGEVLFRARYIHKSRGSQLPGFATVTVKSTDGGKQDCVAICEFPAMESTYFADWDSADDGRPGFTQYIRYSARGDAPNASTMDLGNGVVTVHYAGGEKDGQTETYKVPAGAFFDPNTRPDPYVASFLLQEIYDNAKKSDFTVFDWDNTGKGMASYAIKVENMGEETITVPAGTFKANHIVQTQTSFGDTWFKKRPGHVTDYWLDADSGIIVRILRHREPYEVLLASVEVGADWLNPLEGGAAPPEQAEAPTSTPAVVAPVPVPPPEAVAIAEKQPGELIFKGSYHHRSRGGDIPQPSVVWAKRTANREVTVTSYLPGFNTTYVAYVAPGAGSFRHYEVHSHGRDGGAPSTQIMELGAETVTVQYIGGEKDGQVKTLAVPATAAFEPNSRPDPYAAHMALLLYGMPQTTQEIDLYDWDNTGEGMATYRIRLEYMGQEEVTVPVGTFLAHHYVETQLTFGDTWFKKRPGHVTEYWVLDNGVVVRVYRHREPYELLLASVDVPSALPGQLAGPTATGGALEIVSARYGAGSSWVDVTEQLRQRVVNDTLSVRASNELAGDPIYGTSKDLVVQYRLDGKDYTVTVPEEHTLQLPTAESPVESPADALTAAADAEIAQHYTTADAEVQDYIRWTARTFGRSNLWQPAGAFDSLSAEAREQRIMQMVEVLNSEYGRHLCITLADAGAIQNPRLVPGLIKHATYHRDDSDYDCRPKWMAVSALGRQDDVSVVPVLIPLVDHGNQNTRMWARASLARLTGQWFGDDKQAWARWWNDSGHEPKTAPGEPVPSALPDVVAPERETAASSQAAPELVSVSPEIGAMGVDPATAEIRVTFDQDMDTTGYAWTGSGEAYPETTAKPLWADARTCVLPVTLQGAKFYRVGINAKSYQSFRGVNGVPARDRVLYFATRGLPESEVNKLVPPVVVSLDPPNGATKVPPALTTLKITFDKPMGGGFAWCTIDDHFPETTGNASWSDDNTICTMPVNLKPNTVYRIGLNVGRFNTFQSASGVPMEPVIWEVKTGE